jgi:Fungal Zn(2)-Cys(6) binuclear cluster domain
MHNVQVGRYDAMHVPFRLTEPRARRVKCDETKPHCSRCVKGGRKCEGYAEPPNRSSDQLRIINYVAPNSRSVSPYPQADSREIRALQYFKTRTAPELAGVFSSDIWDRFMLRLAHHQSAVHHALVALGTVHEDFTTSALAHSNFSEFANQEYGKAIRDVLVLSTSNSTIAVEIALATCIVFSCLESLRGHYQSSLSHLISGLNVLEEEQRKGTAIHDQPCIPREILLSLFIRMDLQRLDLGVAGNQPGTMLAMLVRTSIPPCFFSLDEAQYQLDILHHQIIQHLYRAEQATIDYGDPPPPEIWDGILAQRTAIESLRQSWENALNAMIGRNPAMAAISPGSRDPGLIILDMGNTGSCCRST